MSNISITISWSGISLSFELAPETTLDSLRTQISLITGTDPAALRLGGIPADANNEV